MNCTLMPSLELRALIKVAITLWNEDDIRAIAAMFDWHYGSTKFFRNPGRLQESEMRNISHKVIEKVEEKVRALPLPELLKKTVSDFIRPIGLEILKWIENYDRVLPENDTRFVSESLSKLCWTSQGTVDKKKTVEALIRDENLDITKRYALACNSCLEYDIFRLWNSMPEFHRKSFISQENQRDIEHQSLPFLWTLSHYIEEGMANIYSVLDPLCFPDQFDNAVKNGNRLATEYVFRKMAPEEREEFLVPYAEYACQCITIPTSTSVYAEIVCFFLSQMNEEQQLEVLKKYSYYVLRILLDWPWQSLFIEMAKRAWTYLAEDHFNFLVTKITSKIRYGFNDYNYEKLFIEFWQQSPITHKEYVVQKCTSNSLLLNLLVIKDKENIKLVLETATAADRERIIFSESVIYACLFYSDADKMDLLKFFVQECISSKEVMIKFRERFEEYMIQCVFRNKWSMAFELLDDLIKKYNKRKSVEEGNSCPAKRLCSSTNE